MELVLDKKYPKENIDIEVKVERRIPDDRADIVIYDEDGKEYLVVECKRDGFFENSTTRKSDRMAGDMWGFYAEPRYHFMPQFLKDAAPTFFTDNSTFTAVLRAGYLDVNQPTNVALEGDIRRSRFTPGINFRYTEDTVFKLEYQFNGEHGRRLNAGSPRGTEQNNDSLVFSVATFF